MWWVLCLFWIVCIWFGVIWWIGFLFWGWWVLEFVVWRWVIDVFVIGGSCCVWVEWWDDEFVGWEWLSKWDDDLEVGLICFGMIFGICRFFYIVRSLWICWEGGW